MLVNNLRALFVAACIAAKAIFEQLVDHREEKGGSLSGSGLRARHQVTIRHNDRDGISGNINKHAIY